MTKSLALSFIAAALATTGAFAQDISQNQVGSGSNQSLSIGNVDTTKPAKKAVKSKKAAKEDQSEDAGNTQSVNISGNISQNQVGNNSNQSMTITGNSSGKIPGASQNQVGNNKNQVMKIDGKKVEKHQN